MLGFVGGCTLPRFKVADAGICRRLDTLPRFKFKIADAGICRRLHCQDLKLPMLGFVGGWTLPRFKVADAGICRLHIAKI